MDAHKHSGMNVKSLFSEELYEVLFCPLFKETRINYIYFSQ